MPKTICVVDDQSSFRRMLCFALNLQGLHILEAKNGVDALEKLADCHVDMMIIDWQMPEMNGLQLIRHLRQREGFAAMPMMIISCLDDLDARKEARSLGVIAWLIKPFRIGEIQHLVINALAQVPSVGKRGVGFPQQEACDAGCDTVGLADVQKMVKRIGA